MLKAVVGRMEKSSVGVLTVLHRVESYFYKVVLQRNSSVDRI